jgi:hypothetical protein
MADYHDDHTTSTGTDTSERREARLKDDIDDLQVENERLKKLLGQCMERQVNPPVMLEPLDQEHLDRCCDDAMEFARGQFKKIIGSLYWKKDYSL